MKEEVAGLANPDTLGLGIILLHYFLNSSTKINKSLNGLFG